MSTENGRMEEDLWVFTLDQHVESLLQLKKKGPSPFYISTVASSSLSKIFLMVRKGFRALCPSGLLINVRTIKILSSK